MIGVTRVVLEFARVRESNDPYAFELEPQPYTVRISDGERREVEVPWSGDLLGRLTAVAHDDPDPAALVELGELLRGVLEPAGWGAVESTIHTAAISKRIVYITIRSSAAELYALPWGLLRLKGSGLTLAGASTVLVRYEWPDTITAAMEGAGGDTGRVLFAWSAAAGAVPAEEQVAALDRISSEAGFPFDPAEDVLATVSLDRLSASLRAAGDRPVRVLHLLCHGGAQGGAFGLVFDGVDGPAFIDPGELARVLAPYAGTLRLVVLAACNSGAVDARASSLGGVAQTLHRAGFRSVLASRFPLSVRASSVLVRALYTGILHEKRFLEDTLMDVQEAMNAEGGGGFANIQLYAREADAWAHDPLGFAVARQIARLTEKKTWVNLGLSLLFVVFLVPVLALWKLIAPKRE